MKEILIASGKGGTGKTSLTACFARLSEKSLFCDCDVDASNLYLLLSPERQVSHPFYAGREPSLEPGACVQCGKCADLCRYRAISMEKGLPERRPGLCEGCGVCADHCPSHAISMVPRHCGEWFSAQTKYGPLFSAHLFPGEENSGKLITQLRQAAHKEAEQRPYDYLISDGPPGIGCPVISSMSGVDLVVLVTEPTVSGVHDLKRVATLARQFEVPIKIIINKCDLNPDAATETEAFCQREGIPVVGKVPFDILFCQALRQGKTILDFPDSAPAREIREIWKRILSTFTTTKGNTTC